MKKYLLKRIFAIIALVTSITVFMGNACSGEFVPLQESSNSSASNDAEGTPETGYDVIPGAKTASLVYSNQILTQLTSCVGVTKPSDATIAIYEQKKGSISVSGAPNTVTAPMMMAVTSIAGEVCNDLINQEIATGNRIFMNMNLSGTDPGSQTALTEAISRLALSCWQRLETNAERQEILQMVSGVSSGEQNAARKSALMLCTSVLSSLDSLLN